MAPKRVIPPLKKGTLGGKGFFSKSAKTRRRILTRLAIRNGEKSVMGKLQAVAVLNKNTNPSVTRKAMADRRRVAKSFIGNKRVKTGRGLSR